MKFSTLLTPLALISTLVSALLFGNTAIATVLLPSPKITAPKITASHAADTQATDTQKDKQQLPSPKQELTTLDQVIAIVNSDVITSSQLDSAMRRIKKQIEHQNQPVPPTAILQKITLKQLINVQLQLQIAKRNGLSTSKKEVNDAIQRILKHKKIKLTTLKAKLKKDGVSYSEFRDQLKQQITLQKIQSRVSAGKVQVTDAEVTAQLKKIKQQHHDAVQYHVVDLLIALPEKPTTAQISTAQNTAKKISTALQSGTPADSVSGARYLDLGFVNAKALPDVFLKQLKTMQPGSVSPPLRASNGYHVIQLLGIKKPKSKLPSRKQVQRYLFQKKVQKATVDWIKKLRETAYIKIIQD